MRFHARLVPLAVLIALVMPSAAAAATSAQLAISALNKQRAANKIPAGITEDPTLSKDCAAHDLYMSLNHTLTHLETPGSPGYTSGGDFAGRNSVLAQGTSWTSGNPYESAPLHLDQLLAPRLVVLGSADADGYSCTTTFPGWTRAAPPSLTVYTYPGPGAAIYPSETARESPWTPGQLVGLPQGAVTGPNLIVLVDAPGQAPADNPATLTGATLTGPGGPVAVKTVDGNTALPAGAGVLAPYISPGGFIIPVHPLAPATTYHAHVVIGFAGQITPHDWTFSTAAADPVSVLRVTGTKLSFSSHSPASILITFVRAGGGHAPSVRLRPGHSAHLHLKPGSWEACGRQAASGSYAAYSGCLSLTVAGRPGLRLGVPVVSGGRLRFPLHFSSVLRGRTAIVSVTALPGGPASARSITLRRSTLVVPLPARGHGILVQVRTPGFVIHSVPWTAARASYRYVRP